MSNSQQAAGEDDRLNEVCTFLGISLDEGKTIESTIISTLFAKVQNFNELKSQNLKLSVTVDEIKSISTRRTDALKAEIEQLIKNNDSKTHEKCEFDQQITHLNGEKVDLCNKLDITKNEIKELMDQIEILKKDKKDIVKLLEEKISELDSSRNESNRLLNDNSASREKILQLENQTQTLESTLLSNKAEVQTLERKVELLEKNNAWLEEEMNNQNNVLISLRQTSNSKLQESLKELSIVKNDLQIEKTNKDVLLQKNGELSKSLQEKIIEVKDLGDALATEKNEFQREISLKQRLISLLENETSSLKVELKNATERNRSFVLDTDDNKTLLTEKGTLIADVAGLKQKLETSEQERIRLVTVLEELIPENENSDHNKSPNIDVPSRKLYGDICVLKKQLIKEKRQKESLQSQVESFIIELEHKIPVINSFKKRTSMLEKELNDIALLLEHTSNEKEKKEKEFDVLTSKTKQYESNIEQLLTQRSDLAHQVQYLLLHVSVQEDNCGPLGPDELTFIKNILSNEDPENTSDSQRIISDRLLNFKNVIDLQQKNCELLKTIRSLANKLEKEEENSKSNNMTIESQTIKEAKKAIVSLQTLNSKLEQKLKNTEKERDAYKTLIENDKQENGKPLVDENREKLKAADEKIRQLETHIKDVTEEYTRNLKMLNTEIQELYKTKTASAIAYEKECSSRKLSDERLKLLQNTLELSRSENSELLERSKHFQKLLEIQDEKTSQTMNEYFACKTTLALVESKISATEAEKELLKSSEHRLRDEIKKSSDEKNTLKIMVTQLQTLQSEREIMLQNIQRTHNEKVKFLEDSLNRVRGELTAKETALKTLEESAHCKYQISEDKMETLRKESNEFREKSNAKSLLVCQLESETKTLKRELEESKARINSLAILNDVESIDSNGDNIQKELEKTKVSLVDAYSQIEHYKELAGASEESLDSIQCDFTKVKEELNNEIHRIETERKELEKRVLSLHQQLEETKEDLSTQEEKFEEERSELLKKVSTLENSIQPLDQMKKEYQSKMTTLQNDLAQQALYANQAQKNYEQELQKHSEASKIVSQLREELHNSLLSAEKSKSQKEQLSAMLENNEKIWLEQKGDLEAQIEAGRQRIEDLATQNKLLYDQIELFSKTSNKEGTNNITMDQDLLVSLRRERDILEIKLSVSDREAKVLAQKQIVLQNELNLARSQVSELKEEHDNRRNLSDEHQKIIEQLNQLNLLKESNITLRNTLVTANENNAKLQKDLEELQNRLLPLQTENENFGTVIKEKEQEVRLARDEANRWRERSQDILRRQERIDPEEFEKLKTETSSLKSQLDDKIKENTDLNDRFNRLKKQAHEKLNSSKISQATLTSELNELKEAKNKLNDELQGEINKSHELESKLRQIENDSTDIEKLKEELADALSKNKSTEDELQNTVVSTDDLTASLKQEIVSLKNELSDLKEKESLQQTIKTIENDDISNVVESMKQTFEKEKIDFIKAKTQEFNEELRKKEDGSFSKQNQSYTISGDNIDELRAKWKEESEKETLERIQEAEENLKKRIRKPTEERINKIIEKKRAELESEFEQKLSDIKQSSLSQEGMRQRLEQELREKFDNDLKLVKKKAFEEGKQQASMKTTLLERKISKLETQLKERENDTENRKTNVQEETSDGKGVHPILSKIDESKQVEKDISNPQISGEHVLKLNSTPTFNFQSPPNNNPFTSSLKSNDFENKPAFGVKPFFDSSNNGTSSPFAKLGSNFVNKAQAPAFSLITKPENKSKEFDDSEKVSERDSSPNANSNVETPSPLKRSTENDDNNEIEDSVQLKKLKEDSEN